MLKFTDTNGIAHIIDLDKFFSSDWYREIRNNYHNILIAKKKELDQECEDIANI